MPTTPPRVGDTVVLRPTTRQAIGSAFLKGCCALPLLLALPVASGKPQTIIVIVFVVSALLAIIIDLLAQRDIWLRVSPTGIATRSGSIPWWAIDDIQVHDHTPMQTVIVRSFETLEMTLPAPRNGPTGSNPHFQDEARLIVGNWQRYGQVRPSDPLNLRATLERAKSLVEPEVIDLRPDKEPVVVLPDTADDASADTESVPNRPVSNGNGKSNGQGTSGRPAVSDLLRPS